MDEPLDCLIIGGGPAGLTAAIYLTRFHLSAKVVDAGGIAWLLVLEGASWWAEAKYD